MPSVETAACAHTQFVGLCEQTEDTGNVIAQLIDRVNNVADRLYGAQPSEVSNECAPDYPTGDVYRLTALQSTNRALLATLGEQIKRLEDL